MTERVDGSTGHSAEVSASVVQGSQQEQITITQQEVQDSASAAAQPSAEKFGVSAAQFDKYYNHGTGEYNWQAHAKEMEFIAEQRRAGKGTDEAEAKSEEDAGVPADAQEAVASAGLDWNDLAYKIGANGDIDAGDYAQLMQAGIPREVIEQHVKLVRTEAQAHVTNVLDAFGGEERWIQTKAWADQNLSETEQEEVNRMLSGPNYKMAVDLLTAKAGTAMSVTPRSTGGSHSVQPYASQMEMVADQRKPEYRRDPAFRAQVMARAAASDWATPNHTTR